MTLPDRFTVAFLVAAVLVTFFTVLAEINRQGWWARLVRRDGPYWLWRIVGLALAGGLVVGALL